MLCAMGTHKKTEVDANNYSRWLATAAACQNVVFQALDLQADDQRLAALPQAATPDERCVFLGCQLGRRLAAAVASNFALVFPELSDFDFRAFRSRLYSVDELFAGFDPADTASYHFTPDWKAYISYVKVGANGKPLKPLQYVDAGLDEVMARRLHDHFISDEMDELLEAFSPANGGTGVVAVMGGHDRKRSDPVFDQVAQIARELTRDGYLVVSGGGPGLMEAANLGAFFAERSSDALSAAILQMVLVGDSDRYDGRNWLKAAWNVRAANLPAKGDRWRSLGVPTWFYGHEPPNVFASDIAKYFENSIREEGLLAIATHGVIFAEGNAGTVQEILQDCCQNYYENYGYRSPMILFGRRAWDPSPDEMSDDTTSALFSNKPVWPLLSKLARMTGFTNLITLTDEPAVALAAIRAFRAPVTLEGVS